MFDAISKQDKYQQTATIKTLFGQWAIEGVSKIVENPQVFQDALAMANNSDLYTNSMEKELLVKLDTGKAVDQMASNATDRLLINVGKQFLPAKKELASMWIDIANGITENLPDLSNIVNGILPMLHSALLGIGNAAQAALPWIQKGIDYTAEHGPEVAGAITAIAAAFGAMSLAPTAYSTGTSLMNTVGNIFSGQVVGETAKMLSERFGKVLQKRQSMTINRNDKSTSISTQMDSLIPASKISTLTQGMFVGAVADSFEQPIEQKIFHAEIVVDSAKVKAETARYVKIPIITDFTDENGVDRMQETIKENYDRIKAEAAEIVDKELDRLRKDPVLSKLLPPEQGA